MATADDDDASPLAEDSESAEEEQPYENDAGDEDEAEKDLKERFPSDLLADFLSSQQLKQLFRLYKRSNHTPVK